MVVSIGWTRVRLSTSSCRLIPIFDEAIRGAPLWRDLGYDAALIQLVAATIFLVSTMWVQPSSIEHPVHGLIRELFLYSTGLPGVIPGFPSSANAVIVKVFFWTPQGEYHHRL
jgi:hypothetical protein